MTQVSPRGGSRQGRSGTAYANRTDLNSAKPLAPAASPGQQYGQATQQLDAQKGVPIAPPPAPGAPVPMPQAPPTPAPMPGAAGAFSRPTERPDEHVMSGAPMGPGPGPQVLRPPAPPDGSSPISAMLSQLAQQSGNSEIAQLAQKATSLGQ